MSDPVLSLSNISKRFGNLVANDAISLDLKAGEILALLGENGAGGLCRFIGDPRRRSYCERNLARRDQAGMPDPFASLNGCR